jgi:SpoIID/LytB domain protein
VALAASVAPVAFAAPVSGASGPTFTFAGGGWGHGVGMSQWGAMRRAQQGASTADILGAYYPGAQITRRAQSNVRVLLAQTDSTTLQFTGAARVSRSSGVMFNVSAGQTVKLRALSNAIEVQVIAPAKKAAVRVSAKDKLTITVSDSAVRVAATGHGYRDGRLTVRLGDPGSLDIVNEGLTMQQYLRGLGEVPSSWPSAALEAQAIAARTYAYRRVLKPRASTYDITATTYDQAFIGVDATGDQSGARWIAAVDATDQQILTYQGTPIEALYSASNGGYVTSGGYVFGTNLAYLRDDVDPYDEGTGNPNHRWTRSFSGAELGQYLKDERKTDVGIVTAVVFGGNVSASGRMDRATVSITGNKGATTLTGAQFRSIINQSAPAARSLPSTLLFFPATGSIDSISFVPGGMQIAGWVALRGSTQSALARVTVNGKVVATAATDVPRPDVQRLIGSGPTAGFVVGVPAEGGNNKVCLYGAMASGADATLIGCRDLTTPKAFGSFDAAVAMAGGIAVSGWAIAPAAPGAAHLSVSVDGVVTTVPANTPRPDVAAVYPAYGPNHGFAANVSASPGSHQVCVSADGGGKNETATRLACLRVKV